jgi:hypothetical protein
MSLSRQQRIAIAHHGLHLVPHSGRRVDPRATLTYKLAAVAAALFLAMTVC